MKFTARCTHEGVNRSSFGAHLRIPAFKNSSGMSLTLDTLVLAMPVSWKGTLQQYAGRLHREHATKSDVKIIDVVDTGHPTLLKMWDRRQRGYRAMGYRFAESDSLSYYI